MFACEECDFKGISSDNLKDHVAENHIFGKLFSFIVDENAESKSKLQMAVLKDKLNGKQSYENVNNSSHNLNNKKMRRQKKEGKFKCQITDCSYSSNFKQILKRHTDSQHLKLKRYACNVCDYKSFYDHNVKIHQENNHKGQQIEVVYIQCKFCQQNVEHIEHDFTKKNKDLNTRTHRKNYKTNGKFKCETAECTYTTNTKHCIKLHHEIRHLKIKKFACNICVYKAYSQHNVKLHQK